ncbi:MAG: hypothetical protein M1838_001128 [Thelocarpon superellum]|nr:MAG: hypothetical protein M1838_001128 [Thelocarpon superellum]
MSAFDYMFPAGVGHFSQPPHFDPVMQSSFSDYNSIPVPDLPHLDPAAPAATEAEASRYYARPLTLSPAVSLPSPHPSPQDREILRQRRQYHQSRRLAKTRARNERSPSGAYFSNASRPRDVGLGIDLAPEQVVTPSSAHFSQGLPTLLDGYSTERGATASPPTYLDPYHQEHGSYDLSLGMSMPTSHPVYQPSPLPSMSNVGEGGTPERQYRQSPHGTPTSSPGAQDQVRILGTRPKPQCWDHGCNGRQFSTFSNLLRHQREKSGTSTKSYCPRCGAEFTRTTARNGHMAHEKCKSRRSS